MKLKDKVLNKLIVSQGQYLSGQSLADEFSVTRNAIWKAINTLKEDGHEIICLSNKGYCLSLDTDTISSFGINIFLNEPDKFFIDVIKETTSTNDLLIDIAKKGGKEWSVIVAEHQTQGKGRQRRSFYSPKGCGVYLSILLRPKFLIEDASMITIMTAAAVTEVLEEKYGLDLKIKWVNDIYKGNKKVSGILSEGSLNVEEGAFEYLVVGIGINLFKPENGYPTELSDIVAPLFDKKLSASQKNKFIADVIENIRKHYYEMPSKNFLEYYKSKQYLINKEVDIYQGENKTACGIVRGIDDKGRLIVITDTGEEYLSSGEARVITRL